jgi:osmotically-inducible protein OsmY
MREVLAGCGVCFADGSEETEMAKRYEDRYGRGQRRDRDFADDRGYVDRASDEVRSWFGDDEAERRRHMDEQRDREREARYGGESNRGEWSRSDWNRSGHSSVEWDRRPEDRPESWRGDTRDDRTRYEDWSRTWAASDWDRDRGARQGEWSGREADWHRGQGTTRPSRSTWSADEGRMEFGDRASGTDSAVRRDERWGRGPKGYQRSDTRIHEEVCDRLTYSNVDAEHIEVTVSNGEVTLSGSVRDRWDKRRAEDLAEEIAGVRDVHNSIRVARPERGIGQSDASASDQPGTVLGVNPTADDTTNPRRR